EAQAEPLRPPADHYAPGGLMDHVNGVIEEQLRDLDEVWKAKREAEQHVSAPDPGLMMQDSKEDAGMPPVPPPARTCDEEVEPLSSLQARQLVEWVEDQEYRVFSPIDIRNGKSEAALREKIRALVPAEFVEAELQRVLRMMRHT